MPEYTFEEFSEIAGTKLRQENVDVNIATVIAEQVWNELRSKDVRDVIQVGRLASSSEEASFVVQMLKKGYQNKQCPACGNE
jgi:NADH pyrophosphatase NudC (nudix superfamily)